MPKSVVPRFFLYGEPPRRADERFLHLEDLDDRSRPAAWRIKPHAHADLHHLFEIRHGRGTIKAEGDETVFLAPCALIVPAGIVHGFTFETGSEGRVMTVSDGFLRELARQERAFAPLFETMQCIALPTVGHLDGALKDMRRELTEAGPAHRTAAAAHLSLLLIELVRLVQGRQTDSRFRLGAHAQIVARFRAAIEERFDSGMGLNAYCDRLGTTVGRLRSSCKAVAGLTPSQLIDGRILAEAKRSLLYSDVAVSEIAYGLGFTDPAYFSRYFSRNTGLSPSAFRRGSTVSEPGI